MIRLPRSILVVAPHPDDEVIGAALLIRRAVRAGACVRIAIVTDGAGSHPGSVRWPRARLVAERRRESRRALRRLGVPQGRIAFLGLADGALSDRSEACRRALRPAVARCRGVGLLVGPASGDAHPDHRAVAAALARCPSAARRLGYRVWPHDARGGGIAVRGAGTSFKRSLIRIYRTQLGAIRDDPAGFAIARHELAAFAHPVERFAVVRR